MQPCHRTDPLENMLRMVGCRPELRVTRELAGDSVRKTTKDCVNDGDPLPFPSRNIPPWATAPLSLHPIIPEQGKEIPKPFPGRGEGSLLSIPPGIVMLPLGI